MLEAALRAELPLTHACGGRAKCSTCRVWVLAGLDRCPSRTDAEQALAERLGLGDEVRLACQLRPCGDLRVRRLVTDETDLMLSSQLDRSAATRVGEVREVTVFFSDSNRINQQWRICFRWREGAVRDVEIVDYHD